MNIKSWIPIILLIANLLVISVIKFNDLKHLAKDVSSVIIKVDDLVKRVATIEGFLGGRYIK